MLKQRASTLFAETELRAFNMRTRAQRAIPHYRGTILIATVICAVAVAIGLWRQLAPCGLAYFQLSDNIAALRSLLGTLGGALLGATAIVFSLVLFALQVNVERMPHGLFVRLASDRKLLSGFFLAFALASLVAALGMVNTALAATIASGVLLLALVAIPILFLASYRRALVLINPAAQLALLSTRASLDLSRWKRRSALAGRVMAHAAASPDLGELPATSDFDVQKAAYLQLNPQWDRDSRTAVAHATSYVTRYAALGDYEIVEKAFGAVVAINASYCDAKSGTFMGNVLLLDTSLATDGFINHSLELLRQAMRDAMARSDERAATLTMSAMAQLYSKYLLIKYPRLTQSKSHALLAAGYLQSAVKSTALQPSTDLMMEGVRQTGRCARLGLRFSQPQEIVGLCETVAKMAAVGAVNPDHRPLTLIAYEQFADITWDLMRLEGGDISHAVGRIRSLIEATTLIFLEVPSSGPLSVHSANCAPYFSMAAEDGLPQRLSRLVSGVLNATVPQQAGVAFCRNIASWSDDIYDSQKKILLKAFEKRSTFSFDVLHWNSEVALLLCALAKWVDCPAHLVEDLEKNASWLLMTLSWVPGDAEAVHLAESASFTKRIFDVAMRARSLGCLALYRDARQILLIWARKAGLTETGWGVLDGVMQALVALEATANEDPVVAASFASRLVGELCDGVEFAPEVLRRAAATAANAAHKFWHDGFRTSGVDSALAGADPGVVRQLFLAVSHSLAQVGRS